MLSGNKPLRKAMIEADRRDAQLVKGSGSHVLIIDGGAPLHRIPCQVEETYEEIFDNYKNYMLKRCGKASVVFDGHSSKPSTKDYVHQRMTKGSYSIAACIFPGQNRIEFLKKIENKQNFQQLGQGFKSVGCDMKHAHGDADVLIA